MKITLSILCSFISLLGFSQIRDGIWRGELMVNDTTSLPFNFDVKGNSFFIRNAEESIQATITHKDDSEIVRLPDFDAEIHISNSEMILTGYYYNLSRTKQNILFFRATHNTPYRFSDRPERTSVNISGNWKARFDGDDEESKYSIGRFKQEGNRVTGTFLTSTGDYRYLEGEVGGNHLYLSTFDGAHAFLFTAEIKNNELVNGHFFSGIHWHDTWSAVRDENFKLPDERSFSHLKDGYSKIEFSFPDLNGKQVSLADEQFKNKVVIIQIMGSWCPNCLDETKFLSQWFNERKSEDVMIVGLDYEKITDSLIAYKNIQRLVDRYNVKYPILFAGSSNKELAGKTLPMLNRVFAFPTTIYINKDGTVREVHTGFSGPATGQDFEDFKAKFGKLIGEMVGL